MKLIGKLITFIALGILLTFILFIVVFYNAFKNYSEPSLGIDNNIAYDNKVFDGYRSELKKINKLYFESNNPYYFFEKDLKEHIAEVCVDQYFKENNITDARAFRFPINVNLKYIENNHIEDDFVNNKFSSSLEWLEKKGYKWTDLQHTWKIDQEIDCNKSFAKNYESYLEKYKSFLANDFQHKNLQWVDYLNNYDRDFFR